MRIDAGFISGDEVSSHYDPMIAKLIVRGSDRTTAILKLRAALEEYEIAGPITNVEFLKRLCQHPAFIAGNVETGFITKYRQELFGEVTITPEVYAQAALGTVLREAAILQGSSRSPRGGLAGFTTSFQTRQLRFLAGPAVGGKDLVETVVEINSTGVGRFDVKAGGVSFTSVESHWNPDNHTITSFFPHTRLETRLISSENSLTVFQQGSQYRLQYSKPKWIEKALGIKDITNSVLAPMPCKILRVEVQKGDMVKKDQALVVIESMKMETVIRSPQNGVVAKIVHRQGVSVLDEQALKYIFADTQHRIYAKLGSH